VPLRVLPCRYQPMPVFALNCSVCIAFWPDILSLQARRHISCKAQIVLDCRRKTGRKWAFSRNYVIKSGHFVAFFLRSRGTLGRAPRALPTHVSFCPENCSFPLSVAFWPFLPLKGIFAPHMPMLSFSHARWPASLILPFCDILLALNRRGPLAALPS
jgi:hypothetical protein